jgi:hypothetical protein
MKPRIPFGVDPLTVSTGLFVGVASEWWAGLGSWAVLSGLMWWGWIWTRQFSPGDSTSPWPRRVARGILVAALAMQMAAVALAWAKWGELTAIAFVLGLWAYSAVIDVVMDDRRASGSDPGDAPG